MSDATPRDDVHERKGRLSGPEHYRAAQNLLYDSWNERDFHDPRTQAALAHAILAGAALNVMAVQKDHGGLPEWARVVTPTGEGELARSSQTEKLPVDAGDLQFYATEKPLGTPAVGVRAPRSGQPGAPLGVFGPGAAKRVGLALLRWASAHECEGGKLPFWPPRHGDTWRDRNGDLWLCESKRGCEWLTDQYLVCLTRQGDDGAEYINDTLGPMTLDRRPHVADAPF